MSLLGTQGKRSNLMPALSVIVGPPGCGKTTKLLSLLDEEIKNGTPLRSIAFCSFTQTGSNMGRDRAFNTFGGTDEDYAYFHTLHSLCFRALTLSRSDIMMPADYKALSNALGMHFIGHYTRDMSHADDVYLFVDQLYRNNKNMAYPYLDEINMDLYRLVVTNYPRYKKKFHKLDFTDMLEIFLNQHRPLLDVQVAFIDEAQDLTTLQWKVALLAFSRCRRIYIAGDDDQAIFQWAGADTEYFQSIAPNAQLIVLDQSYRLPMSVHAYAQKITGLMATRLPKDFYPTEEEGKVSLINSLKEMRFNAQDSYFILARNNVFLDEAEIELKKMGVVYEREGKKSVSRLEIRKIEAYEAGELKGEHPELKDDITAETPWYDAFQWDLDQIDYVRKLQSTGTNLSAQAKIRVSTIHGVKGDEADHVVLFLDLTTKSYRNLCLDPDAELRVYYVAATRARKTLTLISPSRKYHYMNMLRGVTRVETPTKPKRRRNA
jgi:superfamily I DNA/RNA helicase